MGERWFHAGARAKSGEHIEQIYVITTHTHAHTHILYYFNKNMSAIQIQLKKYALLPFTGMVQRYRWYIQVNRNSLYISSFASFIYIKFHTFVRRNFL